MEERRKQSKATRVRKGFVSALEVERYIPPAARKPDVAGPRQNSTTHKSQQVSDRHGTQQVRHEEASYKSKSILSGGEDPKTTENTVGARNYRQSLSGLIKKRHSNATTSGKEDDEQCHVTLSGTLPSNKMANQLLGLFMPSGENFLEQDHNGILRSSIQLLSERPKEHVGAQTRPVLTVQDIMTVLRPSSSDEITVLPVHQSSVLRLILCWKRSFSDDEEDILNSEDSTTENKPDSLVAASLPLFRWMNECMEENQSSTRRSQPAVFLLLKYPQNLSKYDRASLHHEAQRFESLRSESAGIGTERSLSIWTAKTQDCPGTAQRNVSRRQQKDKGNSFFSRSGVYSRTESSRQQRDVRGKTQRSKDMPDKGGCPKWEGVEDPGLKEERDREFASRLWYLAMNEQIDRHPGRTQHRLSGRDQDRPPYVYSKGEILEMVRAGTQLPLSLQNLLDREEQENNILSRAFGACEKGDTRSLGSILDERPALVWDRCPITGDMLLHRACKAGQADIVQFLLSRRADPKMCDRQRVETPLEIARKRKFSRIIEILESR